MSTAFQDLDLAEERLRLHLEAIKKADTSENRAALRSEYGSIRAACTPFSVRLTPARALAFNSTLVGKTVHSFIAFVRGNADEADQALRAMMLAYDAHTAPPPPDHVKVSTAAPAHVPAPLATSNQANAAGSGRPRPRPRAKPLSDSARAPDGGRAPSTATPIARTPPAPAPSAATTAIPPSRQPFEIVVPFMPDKGKLREARTTTPPAQTSPAPEVIDDDEIQEIAPEEAAAPPPKGARYIVRKDEFHTPPCASCLAGGRECWKTVNRASCYRCAVSKKGCSISKARTQPSEQTRQPSEHSNEEEESTAPQSPPVARTRKGAGKARAPAEDTDDTRRRQPRRTAATARTAPAPAKVESHRAVASEAFPFPVDLHGLQELVRTQGQKITELETLVGELRGQLAGRTTQFLRRLESVDTSLDDCRQRQYRLGDDSIHTREVVQGVFNDYRAWKGQVNGRVFPDLDASTSAGSDDFASAPIPPPSGFDVDASTSTGGDDFARDPIPPLFGVDVDPSASTGGDDFASAPIPPPSGVDADASASAGIDHLTAPVVARIIHHILSVDRLSDTSGMSTDRWPNPVLCAISHQLAIKTAFRHITAQLQRIKCASNRHHHHPTLVSHPPPHLVRVLTRPSH
ncbi:hypothetical protein FPV67DRAFT_1676642 [Lyophyllum atratum]|nr:hypothetical protein FPV67DRAFT_1676642 [Lyophyllum atratum]